MKSKIALILCLSLMIGLCGCRPSQLRSPGTFYYLRTETTYSGSDGVFAPEQRDLDGIRQDPLAMLELYCKGPITTGLENPLPAGTDVLSCTVDNGILTLNFTSQLAQLDGIELTAAVGCLAHTFLKLTDSQMLILKADGALLGGQTSMTISLDDLELQDHSLERYFRDFTVYYTDQNRRYLIGQEIPLDFSEPESIPMQLLEQLTTPPSDTSLHSPLPLGTRVLSASIADGLCTVELSAEFENRRFYALSSQVLSLMSVVNTLTELPEIHRVEFVCDGSLLIRYGSLNIADPLVRDERCIGPVRTALSEQDVTLYLSHGDEGRLIPVPTRLRQTGVVSLAELIVRYLLQDPGTNGIGTRIPAGTQLNAVTISEGICYVDLSAQYLINPENLRWAGRVIAASLCSLPDVDQIQILIDGGFPEDFDHTWFGPLRPNSDWFL